MYSMLYSAYVHICDEPDVIFLLRDEPLMTLWGEGSGKNREEKKIQPLERGKKKQ